MVPLLFMQEEDLNENLFEGLLQCPEEDSLMRVIVTLMIIDHMMNEDTWKERCYHDRGGRPPDRGNDQERGYSRSGRPPDRGPPDDGGPPDDDGPPDDGGASDDGGPPGNGRHLR